MSEPREEELSGEELIKKVKALEEENKRLRNTLFCFAAFVAAKAVRLD